MVPNLSQKRAIFGVVPHDSNVRNDDLNHYSAGCDYPNSLKKERDLGSMELDHHVKFEAVAAHIFCVIAKTRSRITSVMRP